MKVSFCTTCMGRLYQLKETLPSNIARLSRYPDVEFVILNYNSPDELDAWIQTAMREEIATKKVRYALTHEPQSFHASKAKNKAHRVATGEILVNLDADNFVGDTYEIVQEEFCRSAAVCLHMFSGTFGDGTCGRIALHRTYFESLGGYDESFLPVGGQDRDLVARAQQFGLKLVWVKNLARSGGAIKNSRDEKMRLVGMPGMHFQAMTSENIVAMQRNLAEKRFVANVGARWGDLQHVSIFEGTGQP